MVKVGDKVRLLDGLGYKHPEETGLYVGQEYTVVRVIDTGDHTLTYVEGKSAIGPRIWADENQWPLYNHEFEVVN